MEVQNVIRMVLVHHVRVLPVLNTEKRKTVKIKSENMKSVIKKIGKNIFLSTESLLLGKIH